MAAPAGASLSEIGRARQEDRLLATLAGPLLRTALGSPLLLAFLLAFLTFLLALLLGGMLTRSRLNCRRLSRRTFAAGRLLRSRLLSRGTGLRLAAGRRRRLHGFLRPLPAGRLLRSRLLSRGTGLRLAAGHLGLEW